MRKIIYSIIVCSAFLGSTVNTSAQTLEEFIETALRENYQIQIVKNNAEIANNNNTVGNAGKLPTIDLNGSVSSSFDNTKVNFSDGTVRTGKSANNSSIGLSVIGNWTVFDGFRVHAKKDQLDYLAQLGQLNTQFYIEQTVSDIVMAYYQLLYEQDVLKNFSESLEISTYRLDIERKKKEVGGGTAADYGRALVDFQTDSIRLLSQQNVLKSLEIDLNEIINADLEQAVSIEGDFDVLAIMNKDSLLSAVASNNKQLAQQRIEELIREAELRMSKADRFPKIDLFGGYEYRHSFTAVGLVESNRNLGPTFGMSISFNLFNGGANKRNINNAILYQETSELGTKQIAQNLDALILKFYNEYQSISSRLILAEGNVEAMKNVYEISSQQLKAGAIDGFDFRSSQLTLLNTELTYLQLQYARKVIEINLNRLTGKAVQSYL